MVRLIKSIIKSAWTGIVSDPELQKFLAHHPRFTNFIRQRLSREERFGLYLTIGAVVTIIFIFLFFSVLQDLIGQEALIQADLRVINLLQIFRTAAFNNMMLFITYLGRWQVVVFGLIAMLILFGVRKHWRYATALLVAVVGGEFFVGLLKNIIARPRPPLVNALTPESSFSFPSGHSFVAISFYGLLAYFAFRESKNKFVRVISILFGVFIILAIGFSRIYLGVHWPSDVLASYASGAAWLTAIITTLEIQRKFGHPKHEVVRIGKFYTAFLGTTLALFWTIYVGYFFKSHPLPPARVVENHIIISKQDIPEKLFVSLPRTSEDIIGKQMEPINIIVVGTQKQVTRAFESAGWYLTDVITPESFLRLAIATLFKKPYPQAPGTPSFWDTQPNEFAYEQPTSENSVQERHHIHFWETPFILSDGRRVWFSTAHFDRAIVFSQNGLPTHAIDPAVDKEREKIKNDLLKTNDVSEFKEFQIVEPTLGSNQSGNQFFTDGRSYIFFLKNTGN